jgi:hypothetical protein
MQPFKLIFIGLSLFYLTFSSSAEDRIPFYEDYLKDSDFEGFLTSTRAFLDANPDAVENPRLCLDYLMVAKAARDLNSIDHATSLLLFTYPNSLPALHFISSFERGSPKLIQLLKGKARNGDLSSQAFANSFCRAILFIARSQGPELLQDSSLRLQTYLLAQKAEVEEIQSSTSKALEELRKGNNVLNKVVSVVLDSGEPLEKLKRLATLSGSDARFCINYYLAQLSEKEARSPEVLTLSIINALFSQSPRQEEALALIEALPKKLQNEPQFQTFLALSQHLDERSVDAIATLKKTAGDAKEGWQQTAGSFANGLEFLENRKTSLLESLGKAMDKLDRGGEALQLEVVWTKESGNQDPINLRVLLRISKLKQTLEIQLYQNQEIYLGYRTSPEESLLLLPQAQEIFSFQGPGALPIPTFEITRDVSSGIFNYAFNLNFASSSSFSKLIEETGKLIDNPYLGTPKGREVMLDYLLSRKAIWLLAGKAINSGMSYPIRSLNPDTAKPSEAELSFDLSGNLSTVTLGGFAVKNIDLGEEASLKSLPEWPEVKNTQVEKFDFQLFMRVLNEATKLGG